MSDIFIPELMELDSYWQTVVEDAIYDTLKGEKRLHYALRNRKKINQKLKKLRLKTGGSQMEVLQASQSKCDTEVKGKNSNSKCAKSESSMEDGSQDPQKKNSKGGSSNRETPSGTKRADPDRPLLGNGSLEKMKKSQNSFNCEPMGSNMLNDLSDEDDKLSLNTINLDEDSERNKKIQWLHIRHCSNFEHSNSKLTLDTPSKEDMEVVDSPGCSGIPMEGKAEFKYPENIFHRCEIKPKNKITFENNKPRKQVRTPWEENLEKKLLVALAKKNILKRAQRKTRGRKKAKVRVPRGARNTRRKRKCLSPFIKFYLEVYRELCHKSSVREIAVEAARRWSNMSSKQRAEWANRKN